MENRIRSLFQISNCTKWITLAIAFISLAFGASSAVIAQEDILVQEPIIKPQEERKEFKESKINVDDFEIGVYYGLLSIEDFGTDAVMGAKLAYHISEGFFFEASYGLSDAGESSIEHFVTLLSDEDREYTYYNVSVAYNLFPGETYFTDSRTFDSSLYVLAGVGNTEFAGDEKFTFSYGVGYRVLLNDWFAIHTVFKDHMFDSDITGEDKTTHNVEMTLGLSMFF